MRGLIALFIILIISILIAPFILRIQFTFFPPPQAPVYIESNMDNPNSIKSTLTPTLPSIQPPLSYEIPPKPYIAQTFNNCGPATLSMIMSYFDVYKSQFELGNEMRPYQNAIGDNDDKSVFANEFVAYAQKNGLNSIARPNGTVALLKRLISSNIPIVVRTWLHPNEDIGHFRVVRGYDDTANVFIQDDSYEGPNKRISYKQFEEMWQPFNYGYILVFTKEKQEIVNSIIGQEINERTAWEYARKRAEDELINNPESYYSRFNVAIAQYYLGNYKDSIYAFEQIESQLPQRMLWYQYEPILAYQKDNNSERVFQLTDRILNNQNRGFSELYQIRAEVYLSQNHIDLARKELEIAILYNKNFIQAQNTLKSLDRNL